MVTVLGKSSAEAKDAATSLGATRDHESQDADAIRKDAEQKEAESLRAESRALRFDLGEGLLELGLVLCSLYFLSRKKSFPAFGLIAALLGMVLGASGFLI